MCAKYTIKSLTEASLQTPVSGETHVKICTERTKLTETLTKERIEKGNNNLKSLIAVLVIEQYYIYIK